MVGRVLQLHRLLSASRYPLRLQSPRQVLWQVSLQSKNHAFTLCIRSDTALLRGVIIPPSRESSLIYTQILKFVLI